MWAMAYFRELPAPLAEIDPDFLEIFYNFANTYTEESVRQAHSERRKSEGSVASDDMKGLGYSDEDIAGMDVQE